MVKQSQEKPLIPNGIGHKNTKNLQNSFKTASKQLHLNLFQHLVFGFQTLPIRIIIVTGNTLPFPQTSKQEYDYDYPTRSDTTNP